MPGIGMKNLPEDLEFLQKSVPTFKIDPTVMTYYYLLMHVFRTTADAFIHYGLMGFPYPNDDIQKNKEYYLNLASSQLTQMNRGIQRHVLHACIALQKHNADEAAKIINQIAQQSAEYGQFITEYRQYQSLKEQGSSQYKANQSSAAVGSFHQSGLQIFNYEQIAGLDAAALDPFAAMLRLSAQYMSAITLSNEGMSL